MIRMLIAGLIGNYMTTCFVIGLIVGGVQILRHRQHLSPGRASGVLVNAYVLWAIGIGQTINFVMHSVFGDFAAASIGWPQSPFQLELAFSSLGVGVIAFIVHGAGNQLRAKAAVVIATAIFNYGAAGGHIYQQVVNHDSAVNNGGLLLIMDIVIPTVGLALVVWHALARRTDPFSRTDAVTVAPLAMAR